MRRLFLWLYVSLPYTVCDKCFCTEKMYKTDIPDEDVSAGDVSAGEVSFSPLWQMLKIVFSFEENDEDDFQNSQDELSEFSA